MSGGEGSAEMAQLLELVNEKEELGDEFTEEELQQVFSPELPLGEDSPGAHEEMEEEQEGQPVAGARKRGRGSPMTRNEGPGDGEGEGDGEERDESHYQFEMMSHHIFKGKHGKKLYKCDVCGAIYRHSFSLKRHFIRTHVNYAYLCETDLTNCGINLAASASLSSWQQNPETQQDSLEGVSDQELESNLLEGLYCCHSCIVFYTCLAGLQTHVDAWHRNIKSGSIEPVRIPCNQCNMSFIQRHNLMRHIELVHSTGAKMYSCSQCEKRFPTPAERKKHERIHSENKKRYECSLCPSSAASSSALRQHSQENHRESFHPCGYCIKFFVARKPLSDHLRLRHTKTLTANAKQLKSKARRSTRCSSVTYLPRTQSLERQASRAKQEADDDNDSEVTTDPFDCEFCSQKFYSFPRLLKHRQSVHATKTKTQTQTQTQANSREGENHVASGSFRKNNNWAFLNETNAGLVDVQFFSSIAQKVAENLLHHVDGKITSSRNRCDMTTIENIPCSLKNVNLTQYNFPANFNICSASDDDKIGFLLECDLKTNSQFPLLSRAVDLPLKDGHRGSLFVCCACGEQLTSVQAFDDHEANNHPNVSCTWTEFTELDSLRSKTSTSHLVSWGHNSPNGLLRRCNVPPSLPFLSSSETQAGLKIKCTKCNKSFAASAQLHHHIVECARGSLVKAPPESEAMPLIGYNTRSSSKRKLFYPAVDTPNKRNSRSELLTPPVEGNYKSNVAAQASSPEKMDTEEREPKGSTDDNNNRAVAGRPGADKNVDNCSPKRYTCKKCKKKFVYMVTLKKHQMSCSKPVFKPKMKRFKSIRLKLKNNNLNNDRKPIPEVKVSKDIEAAFTSKPVKINLKSVRNEVDVKSDNDTDVESSSNESIPDVTSWTPNSKSVNNTAATMTSNSQEHRCPDCLRIFTYMANFRKHIKNVCPIRRQLSDPLNLAQDKESVNRGKESKFSPILVEKKERPDIIGSLDEETESEETDKDIELVAVIPLEDKKRKDGIENKGKEEDVEAEVEATCLEPVAQKADHCKPDLWRVKEEHPLYAFKGSPAQHHSCPYCQRGFTYLANYRKHIKSICPIRQQIEEKKKKVLEESHEDGSFRIKAEPSLSSNVFAAPSLSIRSQIEDTMLTILRDQTKQNEIIKSSEGRLRPTKSEEDLLNNSDIGRNESEKEKPNDANKQNSFRFRTFSCNICHKIYFSYVMMLKHRLSHKLSDGPSIESVVAEETSSVTSEETAAKEALSRQNVTSRRTCKSAKYSQGVALIPCSNLLENLARGGSEESGPPPVVTPVIASAKDNNLDVLSLTTDSATEPSRGDEIEKGMEVTLVEGPNGDANQDFAIVIDENDASELAKLGVISPELLSSLNGGVTQVVVREEAEGGDGGEDGDAVMFGDSSSNLEESEPSNQVWITYTADCEVEKSSGAFIELPSTE